MRLQNTTDFPNHFLRRLVAFCCRELDLPVKAVRDVTFRNRGDGFTSGHAWPGSGRCVVSVGECLTVVDCEEGTRGAFRVLERDQTTGDQISARWCQQVAVPYPGRLQSASNVEDLVRVTAHELAHLEQGWRARRQNLTGKAAGRRLLRNGGSEANTNHLAGLVFDAFHARRDELLAAWSAESARACAKAAEKPSAVERRAVKARADLTRWERKLKLARTKVKKLAARVRYYDRKAGPAA